MTLITAHMGMLTAAVNAAGASYPKPVTTAISDRDRLAGCVSTLPDGSRDEMMAAVAAALLDGRDPLVDETVCRLAVARIVAGDSPYSLGNGVQKAAEDRIIAALTAASDSILESLKRAVDAAGEKLTAAHELLGELDLDEAGSILKLGPAGAKAWADARVAQQTIRIVDAGWLSLGHLTRTVSTDASPTVRLAAVTLDQYELLGHRSDPWSIVKAGAVIDWATPETLRERVASLQEARETRQRQTPTFADGYRRSHSFVA